MRKKTYLYKHNGFTLIELMISMTISIFLLLALSGVYVTLKRNFLSADSVSAVQEQQRLMLTSLVNSVQFSGYYVNPLLDSRTSAFRANGRFVKNGQIITGTSNNSMAVRYQAAPGDGILNCVGAENTGSTVVEFENLLRLNTATHELECISRVNGVLTGTTTLAKNIFSINFSYAVDSNRDGFVDSYLPAAGVSGAGLWNNVYGVRVDIKLFDTITQSAAAEQAMPNGITQYINIMNNYEYI